MAKDYGMYGKKGPAKRFTWDEVRCRDGKLPMNPLHRRRYVKQARNLNRLRYAIAVKHNVGPNDVWISVNSWYRSPAYNARIGGASRSYHVRGMATDIVVRVQLNTGKVVKLNPTYVAKLARANVGVFRNGGIGMYSTFTHLDHRRGKARWVG